MGSKKLHQEATKGRETEELHRLPNIIKIRQDKHVDDGLIVISADCMELNQSWVSLVDEFVDKILNGPKSEDWNNAGFVEITVWRK